MRLLRIRLQDYRGIRSCELELAPQGVTVIDGDNEAGKSSLAEAVDLVLHYPDSSKHRRIMAVQPVGRDVGTEVEVEAACSPYRFVFTKRWHRQRSTTLHVLEPRPEQHRGREADQRLAEILGESVDLALWHALRMLQGAELDQPALATTAVSRALDGAIGAQVAGDREDALWDRIVAERDRYWTATGRPSVERTKLAADLLDATARVEAVHAELHHLDDATDELARLVDDAAQLDADRVAREAAEAELVERAALVATHRAVVDQARALVAAAEDHRAATLELLDHRTELVADVRLRADDVAKREAEAERAQPVRAAAEAHLADLEGELRWVRGALAQAEAERARAVADADHRRHEIEYEQLSERRDRVVDAEARLSAAEALLETSRVDDELVARIEAATMAVVAAEAAVAASAATFVLDEAGPGLSARLDGVELQPGAAEVQLSGALEVRSAGLVSLRVVPSAESRGLVAGLDAARAELARCCERGGVADLPSARAAAAERSDAERTRLLAVEGIRQDLRDLTLDALAQKVERLAQRIAAYRADRPADPPLPADLGVAQALVEQTSLHLAGLHEEADRLDAAVSQARDAVEAARRADAGLEKQLEHARVALHEAERALRVARDRVPDAVLDARAATADADLRAHRADLAVADAALAAADPATVDVLLENARAVRRQSAERLQANRDRQQELRGLLDHAGEQGLAQRLDDARTRAEHLRIDRDHLEARAAAALLLHDTFERHRSSARSAYAAPFRSQLEQLGRIVFGPTFRVELDDDLRVTRRTLDGTTVPIGDLSVGAREQLGILARLACAIIAAPGGGVPVVIDDALGWTDPARLERMGAAIALAGRSCQVIVLTCTPGRYAAVGGATTLRLAG